MELYDPAEEPKNGSPQPLKLFKLFCGDSLAFPSQTVGTTSAAQVVNLSNPGSAALSLTSIAITGTNGGLRSDE